MPKWGQNIGFVDDKGFSMKVNAIKCKNCNAIIYSRATHDFHWCPCGKCAVDGGFEYFKIVGNREDWETTELNILEDKTDGEVKNILYNDWNLEEDKFGTKNLDSDNIESDDGSWNEEYPSSVDEIKDGYRSW